MVAIFQQKKDQKIPMISRIDFPYYHEHYLRKPLLVGVKFFGVPLEQGWDRSQRHRHGLH